MDRLPPNGRPGHWAKPELAEREACPTTPMTALPLQLSQTASHEQRPYNSSCFLPGKVFGPLGIVEGELDGWSIASSLSRLNSEGQLWVRCIHAGPSKWELSSGTLITTYSCVEAGDISPGWTHEQGSKAPTGRGTATSPPVPEHVQDLYQRAIQDRLPAARSVSRSCYASTRMTSAGATMTWAARTW